ncbi:hypothetical protein ATO6_20080 [Oceanicola sp. 22II-s10i]|uniref:tripartite tricarboxylate transporter TctB family protein n=1 Tax=Oceanicola sp. 22II-s10i TaxID=1317116 RepID=UPI000B74B5E6|nr:tripartite tricarboxylate transporter TctB family protein [Oceanicola sp. 22II-s10i]OWU83148.1 hypothetical protein ATO6_20080 [Oceanicola sp. 22II-s10i]
MSHTFPAHLFVNVALIALGLGFSAAAYGYGLGSIDYFGAGTFPFFLGLGLIGFALVDLVGRRSVAETGDAETPVDLPRFACVIGSLLAFALLLNPLGFVPAILVSTMVALAADVRAHPVIAVVYAVGLTAACYLVFLRGLGLPISAFW